MPKRNDLTALKQQDIVEFNRSAEAYFRTLLKEMILADGGRTGYLVAVQEIAYRLDISTETAKRYVLKYTARSAPFEIQDGLIMLRKKKANDADKPNA
jgi:hypothetical protein